MPLILKHDMPDARRLKSYFVRAGTLTIGRIYQTEMSGGAVRWQWSLINLPVVKGVDTGGVVESDDAAKDALRKAWEAWLAAVGAREIDAEA